jgi:hypothetical protein
MLSQVEALKVELRKVEAWASQADCNGKRATRDAEAAGRDAAAAGGSVELLTRKVGQLEHQVRPLEAGESVARLLTARNPRSAEERVRERERERAEMPCGLRHVGSSTLVPPSAASRVKLGPDAASPKARPGHASAHAAAQVLQLGLPGYAQLPPREGLCLGWRA